MKAQTTVHAAFRNIGDSQDTGTTFCGTLKDAILWLATQLGACSMATRIVIGIGRNEADAMKAIQVQRAGAQKITDDMSRLLDGLLKDANLEDGDDNDSAPGAIRSVDSHAAHSPRDPLDDYQY